MTKTLVYLGEQGRAGEASDAGIKETVCTQLPEQISEFYLFQFFRMTETAVSDVTDGSGQFKFFQFAAVCKVVLLDAVYGFYPLIHPTWIFQKVFGDTLEKLVLGPVGLVGGAFVKGASGDRRDSILR